MIHRRKSKTHKYDWTRFEKVDTLLNPGLGEAEFFSPLTKCAYCRLVMEKESYKVHECDEDNMGSDVDGGSDVDEDSEDDDEEA